MTPLQWLMLGGGIVFISLGFLDLARGWRGGGDRGPASVRAAGFEVSGPLGLVLLVLGIVFVVAPYSPWWPASGGETAVVGPSSRPDPVSPSVPAQLPTASATSTQPDVASPEATSPKPASWPDYSFDGPSEVDVCISSAYPFDRLLVRGDGLKGGTEPEAMIVRSLQAGLRSLNYGMPDPVKATGYFGGTTERAVRSFQERKGLSVDGKVGSETWGSLHHWVNRYLGNCS